MKNISFPVPKGFTPPEGVAEGDSFDFMASGYFKGPKMYLTSVEGVEISPAKKAEVEVEVEEETSSPEMGMVEAVEQGMA
jgi:hypothetical protein